MENRNSIIIGEVTVDFSIAALGEEPKMRLGGVIHAARALWAAGLNYSAGIYCPAYLIEECRAYLSSINCQNMLLLGTVSGAPNVITIRDVREVGHQGYEDILREKKVIETQSPFPSISQFENVTIFPGRYDLKPIFAGINDSAYVTIDVAYDISNEEAIQQLKDRISNLVISTSSDLFTSLAALDLDPLKKLAQEIGAHHLLLKENRGGSRLFCLAEDSTTRIPAVLKSTKNSVGVGDAFTAVFGSFSLDPIASAWRGMQVATEYSQTTFVDDLRKNVQRAFNLPLQKVFGLGGISLTWHERPEFYIYLAAPDFTYKNHPEIEAAVKSLEYHNFRVRRPVQENGEAPENSPAEHLVKFYYKDVDLLDQCAAVFSIPIDRDAGTLVEAGMAIAKGKPVITFDPRNQNRNTMVIHGSKTYSNDLDDCLNGMFAAVAELRKTK